MKKVNNYYLPILPIKSIAGYNTALYAIEYEQIDEWKYIKKGGVRHRIGIRIEGNNMLPLYKDGDILVCVKENIRNITERQPVVVVGIDSNIFLMSCPEIAIQD